MPRTLRDLVENHYSAVKRGDNEAVSADFATDIVWHESPGSRFAGTFTGATEITDKVFARLGAHFEQFAFIPHSFIAQAEAVAVIGEYRAATNGREVTVIPTVHVWRGSGHTIESFDQYTDTALLNAA